MKLSLRHRLTRLPRPGFFTRLSNIIIIQVLFVFAVVVLLVFFPEQRRLVNPSLMLPDPILQTLAEKINSVLDREVSADDNLVYNENVQQLLTPFFLKDKGLIEAEIFVPVGHQSFVPIFRFQRPAKAHGGESSDHELSRTISARYIRQELEEPGALPRFSLCCGRHVIRYYPFRVRAGLPAVLVTLTGHNLVISDRSQLKYALLLLFLCSVLLSLLTVHLISNRFKEPLNRLIRGFEKTAEGELYYLFEKNGDAELQKLSAAFNKMSEALWQNHQRLKKSNYHLSLANQALLESQSFLATLIDSSPSCIATTDSRRRIMIFNRQASEAFGYAPQDVMGISVDNLFIKTAGKKYIYEPGSQSETEVLCRRCDGSTFPAYLIASSVKTRDGKISAVLYIIRDISESKNFQRMMIRLDRYYTRGEMAGEIAHEVNNYLTVLSGNTELMPLLLKKGNITKAVQKLDVMKKTIDKIARFTSGLIDSDPDKAEFEPADLNQLVENTVAFLKPQNTFDGVEITTSLSPRLALVEIDIGQIQQLLVNLLHNSAEALQNQTGQKKIWISTSVVDEKNRECVLVQVKDNGPGLPEGKQDLLFRKRFTTKRKGNGLGLITCRKIVEGHSGEISYRNEGGAAFSVAIPLRRSHTSTGNGRKSLVGQSSQQA